MKDFIHTQPKPEFYTAGGTLDPIASSYIVRSADTELLEAVKQGQFCYILTPRQMGKSSLMVRTAKSLQESGINSVIIDLSAIGSKDITDEAWYLGQLLEIAEQLGLSGNYVSWWKRQLHLGVVQRFVKFLAHILPKKTMKPIVIFVDEIDTTISLPFHSDDYFAAIRALYNQRASNPTLKRLTFVLLGVASPSDLIKDSTRTPFNIGTRIHLTDFTPEEAKPLACSLTSDADLAQQMLDQILLFTGGHPYLTQKTCLRVAKWAQTKWSITEAAVIVDKIVDEMFLSEWGRNTDDNLKFVLKRILGSDAVTKLLQCYRLIREGQVISDNELDPITVALKLSGLIKADDGGILIVRNVIYQRVFDKKWIKKALSEREPEATKKPQFLYDVFISSSTRDSQWVTDYLLPQLQDAGLRVWTSDTNIRPGDRWGSEIERAIEQSCNMLVVLSPDSTASIWISRESEAFRSLMLAEKSERRLVPIVLRQTRIPYPLQPYQSADFTREEEWDTTMEQLLFALNAPKRTNLARYTSPGHSPSTRYNTAAIRNLLLSAFDDDELMSFIFDFFLPFYKHDFVRTATMNKKIQQLLEYVDEHALFNLLLDAIAAQKPHHYDKFRNQLEIRE
jgi:hypothetical protein